LGYDVAITENDLKWSINSDGTVTKDYSYQDYTGIHPTASGSNWWIDWKETTGWYSIGETSYTHRTEAQYWNQDFLTSDYTYTWHDIRLTGNNDGTFDYQFSWDWWGEWSWNLRADHSVVVVF